MEESVFEERRRTRARDKEAKSTATEKWKFTCTHVPRKEGNLREVIGNGEKT